MCLFGRWLVLPGIKLRGVDSLWDAGVSPFVRKTPTYPAVP
ncbi:hypothetical protein V1291_002689 [Nitrobacteraceae bacterium AZCC 1564]